MYCTMNKASINIWNNDRYYIRLVQFVGLYKKIKKTNKLKQEHNY